MSDKNKDGYRLEDILLIIRKDMIERANLIVDDDRVEARHVLENNIKTMKLLTECIGYAEDSTHTLNRSFGKSEEGEHRVGNPG